MKNDSSLIQFVETALASSLGSMTGKEFRVAATEQPAASAEEAILWQQQFSHVSGPSLWIRAAKDLWETVGRTTLQAAGIDEVSDEDCRSTWQEILSQTGGAVAASLSSLLCREVTAPHGSILDTEVPGLDWHTFAVTSDAGSWKLGVAWVPELANLATGRSDTGAPSLIKEVPVSRTFDLLLELALPVAVSFGKTSLQIKEVLKLNTGSIVELDRFVTDPVEVIVNNCVIARGEVVVVDGNYGVRISHLASREDRLRTGMAETAQKGTK